MIIRISKKYILFTAILFIIIIIIFFGLIHFSPEDLNKTDTRQNNDTEMFLGGKLSFRYPKNWHVATIPNYIFIDPDPIETGIIEGRGALIEIEQGDSSSREAKIVLDEMMDVYRREEIESEDFLGAEQETFHQEQNVMINDNISAIRIEGKYDQYKTGYLANFEYVVVGFIADNPVIISVVSYSKITEEQRRAFELILRTVRFNASDVKI